MLTARYTLSPYRHILPYRVNSNTNEGAVGFVITFVCINVKEESRPSLFHMQECECTQCLVILIVYFLKNSYFSPHNILVPPWPLLNAGIQASSFQKVQN